MSIFDRFENIGHPPSGEEFLKFERIENPRSRRPDLHAFLLLDELFPQDRDMVCNASHDEIYLDVTDDEVATLTDEQILELVRCGVRYDGDGLCMFA